MSSAIAVGPMSTEPETREQRRALAADRLLTRSEYRSTGQSSPFAMAASLAIVATVVWGIATVRAPARSTQIQPLKIFSVDLTPTAPPPAPAEPREMVAAADAPEASSPLPLVHAAVPTMRSMPAPAIVAAPPMPTAAVATVSPPAPASAIAAPPSPPASGPIDGADLSVRMIAASPPSYPQESRRRHEQGIVKLLVLVGLDGRVSEVSIANSSGFDRLDRAAQGAVKRWRWSPLLRAGVPVMVRGIVTIPFVLRS